MGASLALTSTAAHANWFRRSQNTAVSKASRPEYGIPAKQTLYATSSMICGTPFPMLTTSVDGRPTRNDSNGKHPKSDNNRTSPYGPSNAWVQVEILNLYDSSRLTTCLEHGKPVERKKALKKLQQALNTNKETEGGHVIFVFPPFVNPQSIVSYNRFKICIQKPVCANGNPLFTNIIKKSWVISSVRPIPIFPTTFPKPMLFFLWTAILWWLKPAACNTLTSCQKQEK